MIQKFVGDVRLVVRGSPPLSESEFDDHISEAVAHADSTRVVLVVLVGDGSDLEFDPHHRAKLSAAGLFSKPLAVLAPAIKPEVVLSRKWVGAPITPFAPDEFQEACDFLQIDPAIRPELYDLVTSSKAHVGRRVD